MHRTDQPSPSSQIRCCVSPGGMVRRVQILKLLQSPLLQGVALQSCQDYFGALVTVSAPSCAFKVLPRAHAGCSRDGRYARARARAFVCPRLWVFVFVTRDRCILHASQCAYIRSRSLQHAPWRQPAVQRVHRTRAAALSRCLGLSARVAHKTLRRHGA